MPQTRRAASGRFARGFNCAQSVFAAFAERFGITTGFAIRLAAPFGAGMARQGEVCGALSGALMVLGLEYGGERPEDKDEIYRITRQFMEQFEERHGTILCRRLLGHDISTPRGMQAARDQNRFATVCPLIVDDTARALNEFLRKEHAAGPATH
jgi:C_GCAxxG_C_C family probable redox protein